MSPPKSEPARATPQERLAQDSSARYVHTPEGRAEALREMIQSARHSICLQMYLLAANEELITLRPRAGMRPWARTFAGWLIEKKQSSPEVAIVVVLDTQTPDDAARTRGGRAPLTRHLLEEAGIVVLNANLFQTRFEPGAYRFVRGARFHERGWRETPQVRWVAAQQRWQSIHNVEDHRKTLVVDGGRRAALTSHNLMDLSSDWHENLVLVEGGAARALWLEACDAIRLAMALPQRIRPEQEALLEALLKTPAHVGFEAPWGECRAGVLGSEMIRGAILGRVEALRGEPESRIAMASAYCSDEALLRVLFEAPPGQHVRLLIDDCRGLPLSPVLSLIVATFVNLKCTAMARASGSRQVEVRIWASKGREMMHLKSAAFEGRRRHFIGGHANYTPNSFSGAWLESDLDIEDDAVVGGFMEQFEALWVQARPIQKRNDARSWVDKVRWCVGRASDLVLLGILWALGHLGLRP